MAATLIGLSGTLVSRAQSEEEVSALVAEALLFPDWDSVFTATAGAGFKDNVFLSHNNPQNSGFATGSAEYMLLHLPPDGLRFNFFGNAEGQYYYDVSHEEYTVFSQALVEEDFNETWAGGIAAQYFYQDQVLDVSTSETNRQAIPVLGHNINLRSHLAVQLPGHHWLEVDPGGSRQFFKSPLSDYWEGGAKFTAGRHYGRDSQVTLSYEPLWRPYDTDPARTASGQAITNSHRFSFRQEGRISWRHYWDGWRRWRTVITGGVRVNEENGGGYYDYVRWFGSARLRYHTGPWDISAEGRAAWYNYQNQAVSATDPEKRRRTEWSAGLEVERVVAKQAALVLRYEFETIGSNDPFETYTVNTVSVSLQWEF